MRDRTENISITSDENLDAAIFCFILKQAACSVEKNSGSKIKAVRSEAFYKKEICLI